MSLPTTLGEALARAEARVPRGEARLLLREASGLSAAAVAAFPERRLEAAAAARFVDWLERRAAGEPVAYLVGYREFWGRRFAVTPDVLIPRPDTETLVEAALGALPAQGPVRILDLGCGSGAIAVTLALERADAEVTAVDCSAAALAVALGNADALGARIRGLRGHWFAPVGGETFDLIVSNPPYIAEDDAHLAQGDLRFEPHGALASGPRGLDDIAHIVAAAPAHLKPGGVLLLEHGYDQADAVAALLQAAGFSACLMRRDLAGQPRVSGGVFDATGRLF